MNKTNKKVEEQKFRENITWLMFWGHALLENLSCVIIVLLSLTEMTNEGIVTNIVQPLMEMLASEIKSLWLAGRRAAPTLHDLDRRG